jgi:hypothetical protein
MLVEQQLSHTSNFRKPTALEDAAVDGKLRELDIIGT